jgi:hypothetical protein
MQSDFGNINFGFCVECRDLFHNGFFVGGSLVCAACAPLAREKARFGLPLGLGPWNQGNLMVLTQETVLLKRCWGCAHLTERTLKITRGERWCFDAPLCRPCFKKLLRRQCVTIVLYLLTLACLIGSSVMWESGYWWPFAIACTIGAGFLVQRSHTGTIGRLSKVEHGRFWLANIAGPLVEALPPLPDEFYPDSYWEGLKHRLGRLLGFHWRTPKKTEDQN